MKPLLWFLSRFWGVLLIAAVWEAWVLVNGFNAIVIARPTDVLSDVINNPGLYLPNAAQTLGLAMLGMVLGMSVGTVVAVLSWCSALLGGVLAPLVLMVSSIPVVALIPILARLLGYDLGTVLAIVVLISFFPSFVFTVAGLRALPPGSGDLFRVLGASRATALTRLALPAAVPHWMIALRNCAPQSIMAATLSEFLMGSTGLGHIFHMAKDELDMTRALGASLVVAVMAIGVFLLASRAERRVRERWL